MSRIYYDEMRTPEGEIRAHYEAFAGWLARTPPDRIAQKREEAERAFHRVGITFAVYGEGVDTERLIPFDIVPRIIPLAEWKMLDRGLRRAFPRAVEIEAEEFGEAVPQREDSARRSAAATRRSMSCG